LFFISSPGTLGKIYRDSIYYWSKPTGSKQLKSRALIGYCHLMPDRNVLLYTSDSSFQIKSTGGEFSMSHKSAFNRLFGVFNYDGKVWLSTDKGRFTIDVENRTFEPAFLPIQNHIVYPDTINNVFWTRYGNAFMKE